MKYGIGPNKNNGFEYVQDFHAEHGHLTGMSQDELAHIVGMASMEYQILPYHGFEHPLNVMRDAAELIKTHKVKMPLEQQRALFLATPYHDIGDGVSIDERGYITPEEYSALVMRRDAKNLGIPDTEVDLAAFLINTTKLESAPRNYKVMGSRVIRRADTNNVVTGEHEKMDEATRLLVEEAALKCHQDHTDFQIETFIRNSVVGLLGSLSSDLRLSHTDTWWQQSARAKQSVVTRLPGVARDQFYVIGDRNNVDVSRGEYPYYINQGSSSVITPEPWLGSPDPSTTS